MQLKKTSIRNKLAIATSTLLLSSPIHSAETMTSAENNLSPPQNTKEDNFSISGLYYSENDRVDVKKVHSKITKQLNEDHILRTDLIYDTMSGASPNGRIFTDNEASENITITTASGFAFDATNTSDAANKKTWLTEFEDTRKAINLEWEYKASRTITTSLGIGTSHEDDYESYTASGNAVFEFNQKRSSLNIGAAIANDTIKAGGGIPEGLGVLTCNDVPSFHPDWLDCDIDAKFFKPAEKIVTDYIIGITHVWNRQTVFQLNYGFGKEDGYLTDPYKQVSVYKSSYGESAVLYEKRPDTRNTNSLFFKFVNVPLEQVALNFSYRYFWDDWDVSAHTLDGKLRINLGDNVYIQGHGRLHKQSAAFFFDKQISADTGASSYYFEKPDYLSADSRLSKLIGATAGVKVGVKFNDDIDVSARVEHMQQHYYDGILPRMKVWIAQLILNMKF